MSLAILGVAIQAVALFPLPDDEEFGINPRDCGIDEELLVDWVAYRAESGRLVSGVRSVHAVGMGELMARETGRP